MNRTLALATLAFFVLGFAIPTVWADEGSSWLMVTKDKAVRGIENGFFGMGGELYHHIDVRSEEGALKGWTLGFWDGLHRGLVRTLVGAYEIATPFYHDKPVLSDLDTLLKA